MVTCKHCSSRQLVKNGFVRKKQRYLCKSCTRNFVEGDTRIKESVAVKKALSVILYSLGKALFGFLGEKHCHSRMFSSGIYKVT